MTPTRRELLSTLVCGLALGAATAGVLGWLVAHAGQMFGSFGKYMPREVRRHKLIDAIHELRLALRDPDQLRNINAMERLRAAAGSERELRASVALAMRRAANLDRAG